MTDPQTTPPETLEEAPAEAAPATLEEAGSPPDAAVETPAGSPGREDPDRALLEAFRAGTDGAFDDLVRRHEARVVRLARRLLGDAEAALDAAQEAFVKAWKALPRFEGKAQFSTWLTRIAINQCRNELRKRGTVKHTRPLSLDEPQGESGRGRVESLPSADPAPAETLRGKEVSQAYAAVLAALDGETREVLVLREVEALSYEDIAGLLDVPTGTIRSRLHRARAEVRRRLDQALGTA